MDATGEHLLSGGVEPEEFELEPLILVFEHQNVAHIHVDVLGEILQPLEGHQLILKPLNLDVVLTTLCQPNWQAYLKVVLRLLGDLVLL